MNVRKLFRKLFLSKEIVSKEGELHFRRWRLLELPFFRIYLHRIYKSDEDAHRHNHPWNFMSFILDGGYWEKNGAYSIDWHYRKRFSLVKNARNMFHKIKLTHFPTTTLVMAWGFKEQWGYMTPSGFMHYSKYRGMKRAGTLPVDPSPGKEWEW